MKDIQKRARAYALKNALAHDGAASLSAVLSGLFADGLSRREAKKVSQMINNEILPEVNFMSREDQKSEYEKLKSVVSERDVREGLSELPNAKKGVVMRIAPSPSGALHVGSALTAAISIASASTIELARTTRYASPSLERLDMTAFNTTCRS